MRYRNRLAAAMAGFAAIATPIAFAAPPAGEPLPADTLTRADIALGDRTSADEHRVAARREAVRDRRFDGPVHPVLLDSVDYGEAAARFGAARSGHVHEGQDMFAPTGTPLVAVADGEVVETGTDAGRGNYVSIYDPAEKRTYNYFHMVRPASVQQGEQVEAGQEVGGVGCTGSCWGTHLHFEVHEGRDPYGPAVDPLPILEKLPPAKP
jgi:murein DD-endopeptidase MepM/ murein hydrolase activator NlpD